MATIPTTMPEKKSVFKRFTDSLTMLVLRLFATQGIYEALKLEWEHDVFNEGSEADADPHLIVEDRGSDTTIFSFAGGAMLFAGQPTFQFRKLLEECGRDCNLVFLRDLHRLAYHLDPKGRPRGLEYYEEEVRRTLDKLKSKHTIAMGDSIGGTAALYFAARCGMTHAIAFSPPCPFELWIQPLTQLRIYFNLPLLFTRPKDYHEICSIAFVTNFVLLALRHVVGKANVWDVRKAILEASPRPGVTVVYGKLSPGDSAVAAHYGEVPGAKLVPLPTAMHNTGAFLKKQDELAPFLKGEIRDVMERIEREERG